MKNLEKMAEEDANDPKNYHNTQGKTGSVWWLYDKLKKFIRIRKLLRIKAYKTKRK